MRGLAHPPQRSHLRGLHHVRIVHAGMLLLHDHLLRLALVLLLLHLSKSLLLKLCLELGVDHFGLLANHD